MIPAIDLHDTGVGAIDAALKDRAIFKRVPEGRLAPCDRDQDRDILEVGANGRFHMLRCLGELCRLCGLYQFRILFNEPVR